MAIDSNIELQSDRHITPDHMNPILSRNIFSLVSYAGIEHCGILCRATAVHDICQVQIYIFNLYGQTWVIDNA